MKLNVFLLSLSFLILFTQCSKDDSDSESNDKSYKLTVNYSSELGTINIDPLLESYPKGTIVKVTATPNQGAAFKNWELNSTSSIQKEMTFTVEEDILLKANFIESSTEKYTLKASCESSQGSISISPKMDSYPMGTKVQISAVAAEGFKFSKWEGISSTDANINIDVTQNLDIKAVFVKDNNPTQVTSDVLLELEIKYNKNNIWTAKAELTGNSKTLSNGIKGAIIKVNSQQLSADDFFIGEYSDTLNKALNPGEEVTITLEFNNFASTTYKVTTPQAFTKDPSLTGSVNKGTITINWESLSCSEYILNRRTENNSGSSADITISNGTPLTTTSYSSPVNDLLSSNIQMFPAPAYYTLWVCPANTISNLKGLNTKSYIKIIGKNSNGISNKPKQ
jgi:hypothetical protein